MAIGADFGQLAEDLSPEDLRSVLSVFATDVRRLVGNLTATAAAEDVTGFQRVAHGLAGAAGAVGASALEQACRAAMTRPGLAPADLKPTASVIGGLADAALADLAAFIDGLDAAARHA
jgi:hypothetical protein